MRVVFWVFYCQTNTTSVLLRDRYWGYAFHPHLHGGFRQRCDYGSFHTTNRYKVGVIYGSSYVSGTRNTRAKLTPGPPHATAPLVVCRCRGIFRVLHSVFSPHEKQAGPSCGVPACLVWHGWRGLNPQPAVLETAALPVELHPFITRQTVFMTCLLMLCDRWDLNPHHPGSQPGALPLS